MHFYVIVLSSAIPADMLVSCSPHTPFRPCFVCNSPYGLKQTQNMSGSVLLTTEASRLSVRIAEDSDTA